MVCNLQLCATSDLFEDADVSFPHWDKYEEPRRRKKNSVLTCRSDCTYWLSHPPRLWMTLRSNIRHAPSSQVEALTHYCSMSLKLSELILYLKRTTVVTQCVQTAHIVCILKLLYVCIMMLKVCIFFPFLCFVDLNGKCRKKQWFSFL